jgi:hypothetical protein
MLPPPPLSQPTSVTVNRARRISQAVAFIDLFPFHSSFANQAATMMRASTREFGYHSVRVRFAWVPRKRSSPSEPHEAP